MAAIWPRNLQRIGRTAMQPLLGAFTPHLTKWEKEDAWQTPLAFRDTDAGQKPYG